jgi:hypothetical protein
MAFTAEKRAEIAAEAKAAELESRALKRAREVLNSAWLAGRQELNSWLAKLSGAKRTEVVTGVIHATLFATWQLAMDYADSKSHGSPERTAGRDLAASLEKLMKEVE